MKHHFLISALFTASALMLGTSTPAFASDTPGQAGRTKVNIYDNTDNAWNVTTADPVTGGADPVIGFVNFRPTIACNGDGECDPNHVIVVTSLKNGAPNCMLTVELVTSGNDTGAGLPPDGIHSGTINVIGTIMTNGNGHGNTGAIVVDVTTLAGIAASGDTTYAHVDIEDYAGTCVEADGTGVSNNEYGASGQIPGGPDLGLPSNIHWVQP